MSQFSEEDVKKLAKLAELSLNETEMREFAGQIGSILNHVQTINQAISGQKTAEKPSQPYNLNYLREDVVGAGLTPEEALSGAPAVEDNQFVVPRILGEE